jgi:3' terminal RNA ribose 2'-O-methyltransferase Hen1
MLLTITTTYQPATELGYLLHKNPASGVQTFDMSFGQAHVFFSEAAEERCTAALLLDVDPVGLVRGRSSGRGADQSETQYVNDRPYVASSFLSAAIAQVYGSALNGRSRERAELVETPLPLVAKLSVLPCRGGEGLLRRLFEPLGYEVTANRHPLDAHFPDWGMSPYYTVELAATTPLQRLLGHLYVLVPVLDDDKHYWVGKDEVEKLLRHGASWLSTHPERELIAERYLHHQRRLARDLLARLVEEETPDPDAIDEAHEAEEQAVERPLSLNQQRLAAVAAAVREAGATKVIDLGCGEGRLLQVLLEERSLQRVVGMDVSYHSLERARDRLRLERLPEPQRQRIDLFQGSLTYRDDRLAGYDAATVVEVIEHLDPPRLAAFERVLFDAAHPGTVIVTTPNVEYNVRFETLAAGRFRHRDHRFEWSRAEFQSWATSVATRHGYQVQFQPIGPEDSEVGSPTQMAVFAREEAPNVGSSA